MNSEMKNAVKRFISTFGRNGEDLGGVELRHSPIEDIAMSLHGEILDYYQVIDFSVPTIIGGALSLQLFSAAELECAQEGWGRVMCKGELIHDEEWPADWLVFGDRNGDAIIIDMSDSGGVYGSIQKVSRRISCSISELLNIFSDIMSIEMEKFNMESKNEDFSLKTEFLMEVDKVLNEKLIPSDASGFRWFFFD